MDLPHCMNIAKATESQDAEKSWAALHVFSDDPKVKAHREETCRLVRCYFERAFQIAEQPRVVCIFDKDDCLKERWGRDAAERGGFMPTEGLPLYNFPQYTRDIIAPTDKRTNEVDIPYAGVIVMYGSTCETEIGLTLTFAHELQHFLQYTNAKPLWVMNMLLASLRHEEFKVWWDFPHEIEARTTAKKVAECLFGTEPVKEYIQERIKAHITCNDVDDWKFIQGIDLSIPYKLAEATKSLVQRHRRQLEEFLKRCKNNEAGALRDLKPRIEDLGYIDFDALT